MDPLSAPLLACWLPSPSLSALFFVEISPSFHSEVRWSEVTPVANQTLLLLLILSAGQQEEKKPALWLYPTIYNIHGGS